MSSLRWASTEREIATNTWSTEGIIDSSLYHRIHRQRQRQRQGPWYLRLQSLLWALRAEWRGHRYQGVVTNQNGLRFRSDAAGRKRSGRA